MIIKKIFNNNVVLAKEKNKDEIIAMGCGIAFKKRSGDILDKDLIEKTFILKENNASDRFKSLLENVPIEQIKACSNIIEYAKANLNVKLNDYIYVTLTDHINHSINLYDEGISKPNILGWEVKKFYNKEYKVGLKALDIIEEYIDDLSIGISNLINIFEPDCIVIGGGFARYDYMLLDKLKDRLVNSNLLFNRRNNIEIRVAKFGNDAGIIGASQL